MDHPAPGTTPGTSLDTSADRHPPALSSPLRVLVVGLGGIGAHCAGAIRAEPGLRLVGLLDRNPAKLGRTLDELTAPAPGSPPAPGSAPGHAARGASASGNGPGLEPASEGGGDPGGGGDSLRVVDDLDHASADDADVAIVATGPSLPGVLGLMEKLLERGAAVVSSCEQLVWPWYRHPGAAARLDAAAKAAGRAVLGTGIHPGFSMDTLAITLASTVRRVRSVRCERRVEASVRRGSLQARLGLGLTPTQFMDRAGRDEVGCAGLGESVSLLAAGLGRRVASGSVRERIQPVLADRTLPSLLGLIGPGEVTGLHQRADWEGGGLKVELDLTMAVGLAGPVDRVTLDGPVRLSLDIPGAVPGDSGTVAGLVNHLPVVHRASPGLHTMLSVPPSGSFAWTERGSERMA